MEAWQLREIIKCKKSFAYFCANYVKVYHPVRGLVPFALYNFQQKVFRDYNSHRFNIIRKFRQGGLSTMTAVYCLWLALFFVDKSSFVISIGDREAMMFHRIVRRAFEYLPEWMRGEPLISNQHELRLETGGSIECYTPKAGRGFAKGLLIIDEAAFIPEMDDFWARVYPTVSTGGRGIIISTVNGIGNWYHQTWLGAESGTNLFHPIHLHYTEHPDYNDEKWVAQMKIQLGEKKWRQEVLGEFLGSAETYLRPEIIKEYLENAVEPKESKLDDALRIWEDPIPGHLYILGCDPSEGIGEGADFSCIQVIDAQNLHQVAEFYSQKYPCAKFAQVIALLGKMYNTGLIVIENNKLGVPVLDYLFLELEYQNLYSGALQGQRGRKVKLGFNSNVRTRPKTQEAIYHTLTNKIVTIRSIRLANEMQTWIYNSRTRKAEHLKNYHDDAIMALGLALVAREEVMRNSSPFLDLVGEKMDPNEEIVRTYIKDESLISELIGESSEQGDHEETGPLSPDISITRDDDDILSEFGW